MKDYLLRKLRVGFFVFAAALMVTLSSARQAYGQQPFVTSDPDVAQAIQDLEVQGATVTCDSNNMYVQFPNGLYFSLAMPDSGAARLFFFDPVTGWTVNMYIADETLWIQHSQYGLINATDGWFDIFYPIGNPFSAAIQNPFQALFQTNVPGPEDPFYTGGGGGRPAPIQP